MNLLKLFTIGLCSVTFNAGAQIITTIAGNGSIGFSGDGSAATAAMLNMPTCVAKDAAGNVYISDAGNNRIRMINTSGIISTFAGRGTAGFSGDGGPATAAKINTPQCITFDKAGNLYFSDMANYCVRKISTAGIITTVAGTGGTPGSTGDGGPATLATLYNPTGLAFDTSGNLYICDMTNSYIRMVDHSGNINTIAGIALGYNGDNIPATAAELAHPWGIAIDTPGNIYFSDMENNRIRKINTAGIITTIGGYGLSGFTGDGGHATAAQIDNPMGVALDRQGNVYFADQQSSAVRKITTAGIISTLAGNNAPFFSGDGGPATAALLNQPTGIWVDGNGDVYIADTGNNRIRRIHYSNAGVAITHSPKPTLSVYPNPGTGDFVVTLSSALQEPIELVITNVVGETVAEAHTATNVPYKLPAHIPAGTYIVSATTSEGVLTRKVTVVH